MQTGNYQSVPIVVSFLMLLLCTVACNDRGNAMFRGDESAISDGDTDNLENDQDKDTDTNKIQQDGDVEENETEAELDEPSGGDVGDNCEVDDDCMEGLVCDPFIYKCTDCVCESDWECEYYYPNAEGICEDCLCVIKPCEKSSDCSIGFACIGGFCKYIPSYNYKIKINEDDGFISEGNSLQLSATLFNEHGAALEHPASYNWEVIEGDTVTVDSDGVITGGTIDGPSTIQVSPNFASGIRDSVTYTNFAAVTSGVRIVALDSKTGGLLPDGGKAYIAPTTSSTKDDGVLEADIVGGAATFDSADCASGCAVHVFHNNYTYISAFGLTTNDILIPLDPNINVNIATGVKGSVDYTQMPDVFQEFNIHMALALFSIPGSLLDLKLENLIGEMEETYIDLGSVFNDYVDLPTGLELYLLDERITPEHYRAQGIPGPATLWALGGFADLNEILEVVTGALGDEEIDIPTILATFIPLIENFYHGIVPGFDLPALPKVDGKPDYDNFEDIGSDLALSKAQTQNAEIVVPELPALPDSDACANLVISIVGAMQTGVGFIPLGLGASQDLRDDSDTANCLVGTNNDGIFSQVFAPQHSGISGYPYYSIAIAKNTDNTIIDHSTEKDRNFAVSIYRSVDGSPTTITYPDFIGFLDAAWDEGTHTMTATDVDGAAFHRVVFSIADNESQRYHHIYWTNYGFTLTLPMDAEDRTVNETGIGQAASMGTVSYDDLFEFNGTNINHINDLVESFSNCELK